MYIVCVEEWRHPYVNQDQPVQFRSQHNVGIYTRKSESQEH